MKMKAIFKPSLAEKGNDKHAPFGKQRAALPDA